MPVTRLLRFAIISWFVLLAASFVASAQTAPYNDGYGPVVTAYLGYLHNEQEVVDARESRHEVSPSYYRRNSNRIRALRQMAVRIADVTQNDYLPELEAVASDEMGLIFEHPPRVQTLKVGEVFRTTFRYLGSVRSGDTFYVFARLDPYEQADLMQKVNHSADTARGATVSNPVSTKVSSRARRVTTP
ncbi:MAG TPA: hypothetical protein VLL54_13750 [Pyrinomonadaceae bacterium]|nr:hypothetical protein [Pyrinomonadaceae bacterium]